ncbi:hypothetical protein P7C70_g5456, partial [Phenoliferia sp. Uapishka_3]
MQKLERFRYQPAEHRATDDSAKDVAAGPSMRTAETLPQYRAQIKSSLEYDSSDEEMIVTSATPQDLARPVAETASLLDEDMELDSDTESTTAAGPSNQIKNPSAKKIAKTLKVAKKRRKKAAHLAQLVANVDETPWTPDEVNTLVDMVMPEIRWQRIALNLTEKLQKVNWHKISKSFQGRGPKDVQARFEVYRRGYQRGEWTSGEEASILALLKSADEATILILRKSAAGSREAPFRPSWNPFFRACPIKHRPEVVQKVIELERTLHSSAKPVAFDLVAHTLPPPSPDIPLSTPTFPRKPPSTNFAPPPLTHASPLSSTSSYISNSISITPLPLPQPPASLASTSYLASSTLPPTFPAVAILNSLPEPAWTSNEQNLLVRAVQRITGVSWSPPPTIKDWDYVSKVMQGYRKGKNKDAPEEDWCGAEECRVEYEKWYQAEISSSKLPEVGPSVNPLSNRKSTSTPIAPSHIPPGSLKRVAAPSDVPFPTTKRPRPSSVPSFTKFEPTRDPPPARLSSSSQGVDTTTSYRPPVAPSSTVKINCAGVSETSLDMDAHENMTIPAGAEKEFSRLPESPGTGRAANVKVTVKTVKEANGATSLASPDSLSASNEAVESTSRSEAGWDAQDLSKAMGAMERFISRQRMMSGRLAQERASGLDGI